MKIWSLTYLTKLSNLQIWVDDSYYRVYVRVLECELQTSNAGLEKDLLAARLEHEQESNTRLTEQLHQLLVVNHDVALVVDNFS